MMNTNQGFATPVDQTKTENQRQIEAFDAELARRKNQDNATEPFELNGRFYKTDAETLCVLRSLMPGAKSSGDGSAVISAIEIGQVSGRIVRCHQWKGDWWTGFEENYPC